MLKHSKKLYEPTKILGNGFVRLVDHMPHNISKPLLCDAAIPEMARISYGGESKRLSDDKSLIRYLMRHHHTSPFEAVEFKFHLKIPLFVERQLIRHRTASVNQISGRYSLLPEEYYVPEKVRKQSIDNKQGSSGSLDPSNPEEIGISSKFKEVCSNKSKHIYYRHLIEHHGIAKEMARIILPQNIFTELYWKIDLHNLLHFLYLRKDQHAQKEIRDVADAIGDIVEKLCPISTKAFEDYRVNALTFSSKEIEAIKTNDYTIITNKRERKEFKEKLKRMGWK